MLCIVYLSQAVPDSHTGVNLASKMKAVLNEFHLISKVEVCVHDNARNMEWSDLGCFGHTLQLCLKPARKNQTLSRLLAKCRKLVGHFKHSTTITAELHKRQNMLDVPNHELIQDVPTRWNSSQQMMERLVKQQRVIMDILLDPKITQKND